LKRLVRASFAHRRKTLANSLELSGRDRVQVESALEQLGVVPQIRAEALEPGQFVRLEELLR
jgi:16S rRNA (adenine1518-N6/adenine1519-N6)-dimethyltransferase